MLEEITFHTSCSKPLNVGDIFGTIELVAMQTTEGGSVASEGTVEYQYVVHNPSENPVTVDVIDVVNVNNGEDEFVYQIAEDELIPAGATVTLFDWAVFSETTDIVFNEVTVTDVQGQCTKATADATVTVVEPPVVPGSCETGDKPQALVFRYTGESCASTTVDEKSKCEGNPLGTTPVQIMLHTADVKVSPATDVVITDPATAASLVTFTADGRSRLPSVLLFDILNEAGTEVLQSLEIHASCSAPLPIGGVWGSMVLEEFIPE